MPMNETRVHMTNKPVIFAGVLSAMFLFASFPGLAEEVSVTPYRPTVSNPAALSEPGWVELETGVAAQNGKDGSRQRSLPYLLKYAFTSDFGVLLGGDAFVSQIAPDNTRISGGGDTTLLLKNRFALSDDPAAALGCEYGFKSPTAATGLGSGKSDFVLNGIYSRVIGKHSLDVNLNVTKLGDTSAGGSAYQYGWASAVSHPVNGKWGVMAELSGIARQGALPQNKLLLATSYEWSPSLVLDTGLAAGISSAVAPCRLVCRHVDAAGESALITLPENE